MRCFAARNNAIFLECLKGFIYGKVSEPNGSCVKCLLSKFLANNVEDNINIIHFKNPKSLEFEQSILSERECLTAETKVEQKIILKFGKGSSPGRLCLRPELLQDAIVRPMTAVAVVTFLAHLVCQALSTGRITDATRTYLCWAKVIAVKRADGGVRPMAVG